MADEVVSKERQVRPNERLARPNERQARFKERQARLDDQAKKRWLVTIATSHRTNKPLCPPSQLRLLERPEFFRQWKIDMLLSDDHRFNDRLMVFL